jgi:uncharacterized protein (DUF2141 family)
MPTTPTTTPRSTNRSTTLTNALTTALTTTLTTALTTTLSTNRFTTRVDAAQRTGRCARALALMAAAACLPLAAHAAKLTLVIDPVADATGTIQIAVYDSEPNFRKQTVRALRLPATTGTMNVDITDLPPGDYAVLIFHDRNGNDKLDTNVMGIPKEPWGASLGDKRVFGGPGWADARFALPDSGSSLRIKLSD